MTDEQYTVDDLDDEVRANLVVRRWDARLAGDGVIVSDRYKTKFMLCSARCARKEHFGTFDGTTFKCNWYDAEDTHPLGLVMNELKEIVTPAEESKEAVSR